MSKIKGLMNKIRNLTSKKKCCILSINGLSILLGLILSLNGTNELLRNVYILGVFVSLAIVVFSQKDDLMRPMSYLIISFVIFLWARPLLATFKDISIISAGNGITDRNITETILFLGIMQNIIIIISVLFAPVYDKVIVVINKERKYKFGKDIEIIVFAVSAVFLLIFLGDSIIKIPVILQNNYLAISENILLDGYVYFRIGKLAILVWVIFGTKENRFEIATTLLFVATIGFLIRGARGYFISYFFLWFLFFAKNRKIKILPLCLIAVGLILLANFVLFYRMGWTVSAGVFDTIIDTLYSQGASIEPVFGSMHFTSEIGQMFPKAELLFRYDFGNFIDQARGVAFVSGGFGDSFFAELYFLGLPFATAFLTGISFCVGFLEKVYFEAKKRGTYKNNFNLLLFMTMPNLIYFARGDIKDFIFKTLISLVFVFVLVNIKKKTTELSLMNLFKKKHD